MPEKAGMPDIELAEAEQETDDRQADFNHEASLTFARPMAKRAS
jgi:hypothetical protein